MLLGPTRELLQWLRCMGMAAEHQIDLSPICQRLAVGALRLIGLMTILRAPVR